MYYINIFNFESKLLDNKNMKIMDTDEIITSLCELHCDWINISWRVWFMDEHLKFRPISCITARKHAVIFVCHTIYFSLQSSMSLAK